MTAEEFRVWSERQPKEDGRFELWDGKVLVTRGPAGSPDGEVS